MNAAAQDPQSQPRPRPEATPGPTGPGQKSRLRARGRSGPLGPFSLAGSSPLRCTALLRPSGGGRAHGRAALVRDGRSTAPPRGPSVRRGCRPLAVSPATPPGRSPGNARLAAAVSVMDSLSSAGPRPPRDRLGVRSSGSRAAATPWARFSAWLECVCVVTFDLELGQAMEVSGGRGAGHRAPARPLRVGGSWADIWVACSSSGTLRLSPPERGTFQQRDQWPTSHWDGGGRGPALWIPLTFSQGKSVSFPPSPL